MLFMGNLKGFESDKNKQMFIKMSDSVSCLCVHQELSE